MYDFTYRKADTIESAVAARDSAEDGTYMAGGMTLIPTLKQRLAQPSDVIDIGGMRDILGIRDDGKSIAIGAGTTHKDVAASDIVSSRIAALATLAGNIGDPAVRNRGTIGGSVANNDPAADYPAACLALGATIVTDRREITADDFFTGMFDTALEDGELITEVIFPVPKKAAYGKFDNPASRYAIVGVFVAQFGNGARVAVTGASQNGVFRASDMEQALTAEWSANAVAGIAVPAADLNADIHSSAAHRAHLVTVMAKRAVAAA